ncbi:MAG TPA: ABC transporter ATP-binding protein [Actinomycetes bacterium]|nr:ABC transporter ATP-binding protein [Actinomycetes bacterium]
MARYCVGASMEIDWGEDEPQAKWDWCLAKRVFVYFRPYWRYGLAAIACLAAGAALGLVPAVVTKAVIDALAHPDRAFGKVMALILVGVGASLVGGLVGVAESWCSATISQRIMFDLREQLFNRLLRQSVGFFTRSRTGDVMSRIGNDVNAVKDVVADTILGLVYNLFVVPSTLALMVVLNWRLTVLALLLMPLALLPSRRVGRITYEARKQTQTHLGRMTAYLQEILGISGILLVKAFVTGRRERARFRGLNDELRRLQLRQEMIGRWFYMLMDVLQTAGPAVLWLYGGWLVFHGQATVGTVVTFIVVLAGRLGGAIGQLGSLNVNITGSLALFHRIFAVLDLTPEVADAPGARPLEQARGAVAFERVTFTYTPDLRPALRDVSFQVEPGQLAALVGPTGAGKSTAVSLVPRFHDPQQGRVLVDGHDVRDLTLESLGGHIGIVFQDTFLFHASIADNLRYARPDATDEELVEAATAAHLHPFITSLPEGYDTVVGERGHRLSGGEKQRVAIARVVLKDPRILLLDEATSHLDTVSEQLIQAALKPLFAGRTTIAIAHRLSTVLAADQILVLDGGRLVERGTHLELLARGGLYAELYERQFQSQEAASAQPVA